MNFLKRQSGSCVAVWRDKKLSDFSKISLFVLMNKMNKSLTGLEWD